MEKAIETILKKYDQRTQRHIDVLAEDFDNKLKLIAEQYDSIIKRLDRHERELVSIRKDIEIMKVDIAFIKSGLKKKVDLEEFEALEKRVVMLEAKTGKIKM